MKRGGLAIARRHRPELQSHIIPNLLVMQHLPWVFSQRFECLAQLAQNRSLLHRPFCLRLQLAIWDS